MDQLTWLQQSLQKPRLSAVARVLAEVFPHQPVLHVMIGESGAVLGTYNSASRLNSEHLEYPGYILRYREFSSGGNYVGYGWARPYIDHIGILGGQVTVANDGFMTGVQVFDAEWSIYESKTAANQGLRHRSNRTSGAIETEPIVGFASLTPSLPGLLTSDNSGPLVDSDGTILLTNTLTFEEPLSRGFTSIQWLTESETRRS